MTEKLLILDFVYKNCEESRNITAKFIETSKNNTFIDTLYKLYEGYEEFYFNAKDFLNQEFVTPVPLNSLEEFSSELMVRITTSANKSSSKMAQTLIDNIQSALIEIINLKTSYEISHNVNNEQIDTNVLEFLADYEKLETQNIKSLEKFL